MPATTAPTFAALCSLEPRLRALPPRGLILATGEDVPEGHSIRARLFAIEVRRGDVDLARLTECQRDAGRGLYAQAMAGFVAWLAPRYGAIRNGLAGERAKLRDEFVAAGGHARTPDIIANVLLGLHYLRTFARDVGAIDGKEAEGLWPRPVEAPPEPGDTKYHPPRAWLEEVCGRADWFLQSCRNAGLLQRAKGVPAVAGQVSPSELWADLGQLERCLQRHHHTFRYGGWNPVQWSAIKRYGGVLRAVVNDVFASWGHADRSGTEPPRSVEIRLDAENFEAILDLGAKSGAVRVTWPFAALSRESAAAIRIATRNLKQILAQVREEKTVNPEDTKVGEPRTPAELRQWLQVMQQQFDAFERMHPGRYGYSISKEHAVALAIFEALQPERGDLSSPPFAIPKCAEEHREAMMRLIDWAHLAGQQATPSRAADTEPTARKKKPRKASVNARMLDAFKEDPERRNWSSRKWAHHLGCCHSQVVDSDTWKQIQKLHDEERAAAVLRRSGGRPKPTDQD